MKLALAAVCSCVALTGTPQEPTARPGAAARLEDSEWLAGVLRSACAPSADSDLAERLTALVDDPAKYRLQVLVSKVVPGEPPRLERHAFRVDAEYVYPASAIKTCAAIAAVLALEELGVALETPLAFHPLFGDELYEREDPTNLNGGAISVHHELRKLFLVSDNRAYNRLYELVGHEAVNERMWSAGLAATRLQHRLAESRSREDNLRTPRVEILVPDDTPREASARTSTLLFDNGDLVGIDIGRAHVDANDVVVEKPLSFLHKNWMSLVDLQDMNVLLVRPDLDVEAPGFPLTTNGRVAIVTAMSEYAADSQNPSYDPVEYPRTWGKYLLAGLERVAPGERWRIANKVGRAYGFSIENAYVEDRATGRAFFVTAVLYTNANGVLNDGVYEYEEIADPFFVELGEELARELAGP